MRILAGVAEGSHQSALHLAAELQREQATEHMPARAALLADKHGPDFQQPGLHRAKVALDFLQGHASGMNGVVVEFLFGDIGHDRVAARQFQGAALRL